MPVLFGLPTTMAALSFMPLIPLIMAMLFCQSFFPPMSFVDLGLCLCTEKGQWVKIWPFFQKESMENTQCSPDWTALIITSCSLIEIHYGPIPSFFKSQNIHGNIPKKAIVARPYGPKKDG